MQGGKNYIFAIGIDDYMHYDVLHNAVKDIKDIIDTLTKLYQFDVENIFTLFNDDATEEAIDNKFIEIIDTVSEKDNLIILYSGHGFYRQTIREGYWVPVDGRLDTVADYISNASLIRYLENMNVHHLLLLIDSCFSATLLQKLRGDSHSEEFPSRRIFASGREEVPDGIPGENSPFAKGIISFLRQNPQKEASTTSLIGSVKEYVKNFTNQIPQEGRLRTQKDDRGEFFFRRKQTEEDIWLRAKQTSSPDSYEEYLKLFPEGKYYVEARMALKEFIASQAWNEALLNNTIDDFLEFQILYPDSRWVEEAQVKINDLQRAKKAKEQARQERILQLKSKKAKEEELEKCKEDYKNSFERAIKNYEEKNYKEVRKLCWKCLELYRADENFTPSKERVKNLKSQCNQEIKLSEYMRDIERALKINDYEGAIGSINSVLEIRSNEDLIQKRDFILRMKNSTKKLSVSKRNRIIIGPKPIKKKKTVTVKNRDKSSSKKNILVPTRSSRPAISVKPNLNKVVELPKHVPIKETDSNKKDRTYLWITLLIISYFILIYLLDLI